MKTAIYVTIFFTFTFIVFLFYLVIWALAYPFDRNRIVSHMYSRFWSKGIYHLCPWWNVEVEGLEKIEKGKSYIVLSNHQAMLDIPLLYNLPFNFKWVSKEEVFKIPIFGWVLAMHDDIAIKRGGAAGAKKMMNKCDRYLKRGVSIVMFPEGTRTKTGKVGPFMQGAFLLAKKSKVELLPVVIEGTYDALKGGTDGSFGVKAPHKFKVKVLDPIPVADVTAMRFDEISDKLHNIIEAEHRVIAPQYYESNNHKNTTTHQSI